METPHQSSTAGNKDVGSPSAYREDGHTPQPNKLSTIAEVARRQILKAGAFGSPVRRSPRLSCLPPPQPSEETFDADETSADESDSVNDVALQLSREETPENDSLPDEPSTVLASRILRAHDNPSPPPQDLAHPGTNYTPGRDHQFPLLDISVPPSPFRAINLLERLNQLSGPAFESSSGPWTPDSVDRPAKASGDIVQPTRNSPTLFAMHMPNAEGVHTISTARLSLLNDVHTASPRLVSDPANRVDVGNDDPLSELASGTPQATTMFSSSEPEVSGVPSTSAIVRSPEPNISTVPSDCHGPLHIHPLPYHPANGDGEGSSSENGAHTRDEKDDSEAGMLPRDRNIPSTPNQGRSSPICATSHERLRSLSPNSSKMLTGLFLPSQLSTSIEHVASVRTTHPPTTPTRTLLPLAGHPNFSQTTIQRPVIAPTPVRASGPLRKLTSPLKFASDFDEATRTPAQRVPIRTALSREIPSVQRTIHLASGSDLSNTGRFPIIRPPVFSRPALDDPSRSPAKRVSITESIGSPMGGEEVQPSPTRPTLRARSASVEPCPRGIVPTRSQSLEPFATLPKHDEDSKAKESIFPTFPASSRSGIKLPFPLLPGRKPHNDLPPSIPEESEPVTTGKMESNATSGKVSEHAAKSQLKQPSTSSRIPRIGSKPYARPSVKPSSKNGKSIVGVTINTAGTTAPLRFPPKGNQTGISNNNGLLTQPVDTQLPAGALKRKRGGETTAGFQPVMIRQVVPGMLGGKYAPKHSQPVPETRLRSESTDSSPPKPTQPMKFRKVVDGMLSARYAPSKVNITQTPPPDALSTPPSPLSDVSSSSNDEATKEKPSPLEPLQTPNDDRSNSLPIPEDDPPTVIGVHDLSSPFRDTNSEETSRRPRRTSRSRKPAQQQYVLDVFSTDTTTRSPPARRKPQTRGDGDGFMGMSATALKTLTTSNTTKNQQTVAVFTTEIIRKEGLRPESPTVKMKTILQKRRDERDMRRKERAVKRAQINEGSGASDTEAYPGLGEGGQADNDENQGAVPLKHRRGPGDEEDYETPERPARNVEPLKLEGVAYKDVKLVKRVKWHRGLSTAVYLDELPPKRQSLPKDALVVKGCLAPTSKNLPLDSLGNLLDIENRPLPELLADHVVVKKYLYDNEIEPEPIPQKVTRSKSKKSKS